MIQRSGHHVGGRGSRFEPEKAPKERHIVAGCVSTRFRSRAARQAPTGATLDVPCAAPLGARACGLAVFHGLTPTASQFRPSRGWTSVICKVRAIFLETSL
jgi:hypothetical protein